MNARTILLKIIKWGGAIVAAIKVVEFALDTYDKFNGLNKETEVKPLNVVRDEPKDTADIQQEA
jgi:hypothetical protein